MNAFLCIFAGRPTACIADHCKTGLRIFCDYFLVNFQRFWVIFASMAWAKQYRERQKYNSFMYFHRSVDGVRFWSLQYRNPWFSWSFCDDFNCSLASFCMVLGSRLEAWYRYMNGPRSNSKRVIFIIFWSIFCVGKNELSITFCGVPEK